MALSGYPGLRMKGKRHNQLVIRGFVVVALLYPTGQAFVD